MSLFDILLEERKKGLDSGETEAESIVQEAFADYSKSLCTRLELLKSYNEGFYNGKVRELKKVLKRHYGIKGREKVVPLTGLVDNISNLRGDSTWNDLKENITQQYGIIRDITNKSNDWKIHDLDIIELMNSLIDFVSKEARMVYGVEGDNIRDITENRCKKIIESNLDICHCPNTHQQNILNPPVRKYISFYHAYVKEDEGSHPLLSNNPGLDHSKSPKGFYMADIPNNARLIVEMDKTLTGQIEIIRVEIEEKTSKRLLDPHSTLTSQVYQCFRILPKMYDDANRQIAIGNIKFNQV